MADAAHDNTDDARAVQRLGRNYDRLIQRGVDARVQRAKAGGWVGKPDTQKKLERLARLQAERERKLEKLAEKHPNARAIKQWRKGTPHNK